MNAADLAWCGGFFDGEGWIGLVYKPNPSKGIRSYISQKDREVLDIFQSKIGFGRINGPYKSGKHCQLFRWEVSKYQDVKKLYTLLQPYLHTLKLQQFQQAIEKFENRPLK